MSGKSELKIFDDHPPQVVVQSATFEEVFPSNALDASSNVIEFRIPGSNIDYLDLNDTLMVMSLKIVGKDGKALAASVTNPVPSNYFMYTLFSDISLHLNEIQIEGGHSMYPCISMMKVKRKSCMV
jgi:hypothetical protein